MEPKLSISLASLVFAGGVAVGVTGMKLQPTEQPKLSEQVVLRDVLKTATQECLTRVQTVCPPDDATCAKSGLDCQMVEVIDGTKCTGPRIEAWMEQTPELDADGKETGRIIPSSKQQTVPGDCKNAEVTGWQCNGAFMARAEQDCLNEAMRAEVKEPVAEPITEKLEP